MIRLFQEDGKAPETPAPGINIKGLEVAVIAEAGPASLGYRVNNGDWQLYVAPVTLRSGDTIEAKAVRYGWRESAVAKHRLP